MLESLPFRITELVSPEPGPGWLTSTETITLMRRSSAVVDTNRIFGHYDVSNEVMINPDNSDSQPVFLHIGCSLRRLEQKLHRKLNLPWRPQRARNPAKRIIP